MKLSCMAGTIVVDVPHYAFVQTLRMYNTVNPKLRTLGDNDVSLYYHQL